MSERRLSLATRALRGMAWAYGAYVGGRILVLVQTAILARLLTPADFGVVALALTFMIFLDAIKDLGLGQALIVGEEHENEARAQTAFGWGIALGLGLMVLTSAAGPLAAAFFREDDLVGLLPVLGATFLVRALGATHYALARKALDYRVRTASEIAEVTVRGVVGIALALSGAGAWSLAIGFLCGTVASTVMLWALVDFRPRARLSRAYLREMLAFGGLLTVVDVGAVLAYNLDYLFIGRVLGSAALGFYSIAFRLPELLVLNLATVAADVLFPTYAAADRSRLNEAYLVTLRYTAMLTLPVTLGLVVFAEPLILVLFGDQWGPSVEVMQVIAVYAFAVTLGVPSGTVYKVTRRAWIDVAFTIPGLAILIVLLAIFADEGILAVALCTAALPVGALPITVAVASYQMRLSPWTILGAVAPAFVAGAAMAAVMVPLAAWIEGPVPALLAGGGAGLLAYAAATMVVSGDDVRRLKAMAFSRG